MLKYSKYTMLTIVVGVFIFLGMSCTVTSERQTVDVTDPVVEQTSDVQTPQEIVVQSGKECSKSIDCAKENVCLDGTCKNLNCGECHYATNHRCVQEACCIDPDCDDQKVSTKDTCQGVPKKCSNTVITACVSGDGYCPSGCTHDKDTDCKKTAVSCGTDGDCFKNNLEMCNSFTFQMDFLGVLFDISTIDEGQNCRVRHVAHFPPEAEGMETMDGKYFDCMFTKQELKQDINIYQTKFENTMEECSGPYIDAAKAWQDKVTCGTTMGMGIGFGIDDDGTMLTLENISGENGSFTIDIGGVTGVVDYNETKTINGHTVKNVGTKKIDCEEYVCNPSEYMAQLEVDCE